MKRNLFVTAMLVVIALVAGYNWLADNAESATETGTIETAETDLLDNDNDRDTQSATPQDDAEADAYSEPASDELQPGDSADEYIGKVSSLPDITLDDLPPEALDTMALIYTGGPFPFSKDDSVFQNREGILPDQDIGYYREYTVITPGENDRGARRIVGGSVGELYYTADHYDSFSEIDQNS